MGRGAGETCWSGDAERTAEQGIHEATKKGKKKHCSQTRIQKKRDEKQRDEKQREENRRKQKTRKDKKAEEGTRHERNES
jgi:hypothetical protein